MCSFTLNLQGSLICLCTLWNSKRGLKFQHKFFFCRKPSEDLTGQEIPREYRLGNDIFQEAGTLILALPLGWMVKEALHQVVGGRQCVCCLMPFSLSVIKLLSNYLSSLLLWSLISFPLKVVDSCFSSLPGTVKPACYSSRSWLFWI